jgi:hypothetical protein
LTILKHIVEFIKSKGHQILIALLLFFYSPLAFGITPAKLDSITPRQVWLAAQVLPGLGQVINKQYWKVPIFYAGMGSMVYLGIEANKNYHATVNEFNQPYYSPLEKYRFEEKWTRYRIQRNLYYIGATSFYIASVADALMVRTKEKHSPLTATILSTLMPGMGQVYNQKLWKVPFVWGGMATIYYVIDFNQRGYKRFGDALKTWPDNEYGSIRSQADLLFLRNGYRRNRDLSIIGFTAFYVLNIIDAYVDAHFFDWDISDNLALNFEPIILNDVLAYSTNQNLTLGLKLNINF